MAVLADCSPLHVHVTQYFQQVRTLSNRFLLEMFAVMKLQVFFSAGAWLGWLELIQSKQNEEQSVARQASISLIEPLISNHSFCWIIRVFSVNDQHLLAEDYR